ncbi:hypothetical protein RND71_021615 [Anisodus tanguticus]|uniref:Uncharacterized protein n=1 Tax=Anisodus tanguticus TaxID=243964 RepID=A0AAE1RWV2_9SOLA|nr:hypothetical protein RND71_021615 [Anisodus tanguticus]
MQGIELVTLRSRALLLHQLGYPCDDLGSVRRYLKIVICPLGSPVQLRAGDFDLKQLALILSLEKLQLSMRTVGSEAAFDHTQVWPMAEYSNTKVQVLASLILLRHHH